MQNFIGEEEAVHFDEKFIQLLDESDNTGCDNMLAKVIGEFKYSTGRLTSFWNGTTDDGITGGSTGRSSCKISSVT